jgi:hypothetical protein
MVTKRGIALISVFSGVVLTATTLIAQPSVPSTAAKETSSRPAVPVEPIAAMVEAFRTHSIVALGNLEFYGNEQCHAFQLSLIRDPRFSAAVNDIVVEFGDAKYQDTIDRFVRGEEVPYETLRRVWQDTTQVEYIWDFPIYEEFFRAVRTANASLPRSRQLRVLLGDPSIDWDGVRTGQDLDKYASDRDRYTADLVKREVLAKGHRALLIYGTQHLLRKNTAPGALDEWANGIVARLEKENITTFFTVLPESRHDLRALQPSVASWPKPSLALLRGTTLGAALWDAGPQGRPVRLEDQFDAILYLGPPASMTMSKLSPALCADHSYMDMRLGRLSLIPPPPGAPFTPVDQLKDYCAHPGGLKAIPDPKPEMTEMVRALLRDAAQGKVDPARIAPESRQRLVPFLKDIGARFLAPAGNLESFTLLLDTQEGNRNLRRYLAAFANGRKIMWNITFSAEGTVVSLEPRPE